jgi:hypothetical protein
MEATMVVEPTGEIGELPMGLLNQLDVLLTFPQLVADFARDDTRLTADAAA